MAIPLALGLGSLASAQGVPVIDGSNLARAVSRVEELARDALRQGQKRDRSVGHPTRSGDGWYGRTHQQSGAVR